MNKSVRYYRLYFLSTILILTSYYSFSQTITGLILSTDGEAIPNITVTIKANEHGAITSYAISDNQGRYRIKTNGLNSFILEFRRLSYISKKELFIEFTTSDNETHTLDIILEPDPNVLEEVLITTEKRRITVKKDTIVFDPSSFRDGTEKVVEDLIKKLPGMKVENDGRISFKGNPVERLLLDGDNLFDDNYTIGTKNIDVDMIDKLSAIENYVNNPLLHGIGSSNSVAIDLTLKKGKTDFSGTTEIGAGIENKTDLHSTLLGISKKMKSFAIGSYNNIGKEYSPYNYFSSGSASTGDKDEENYKLQKIIQDNIFYSDVTEEQARINNNLFTSANGLLKISEKISGKFNLDYKKDLLDRWTATETMYFDQAITDVKQSESLVKKPELFNIKSEFNFKLSEKENLLAQTRFKNENLSINNNLSVNERFQKSITSFKENQFLQKLNYTNRLGKKTALIANISFNNTELSQNLSVAPDYRINTGDTVLTNSRQNIFSEKNYFDVHTYVLKGDDDFKIKTGAGYTFDRIDFNSLFYTRYSDYSANHFRYQNQYPWIENELFFKINRFNFITNIKAAYSFQKTNDYLASNSDYKNSLLILPKARISYSFNNIKAIRFSANYQERFLNESYLYNNLIAVSNTQTTKNIASLGRLKSFTADLGYHHNDFFNLTQFLLGISYNGNQNNYLSNMEFNDIFHIHVRELTNTNFDNYSIYAGLDKYVSFLKSNVKINSNFGVNSYQNAINDSGIRDNITYSNQSSLNIKTGFLGIINFENYFQHNHTAFQADNADWVSFSSLNNSFKTYINPTKRLKLVTDFRYYLPDVNKKTDFLFIDTTLSLTSKNGNVDYSLISKNISAKKSEFSKTGISDYFTNTTTYNLLNPYILFSVRFKM